MEKNAKQMAAKGAAFIGAGALLLAASIAGFWDTGNQGSKKINTASVEFSLGDTQYYTITDDGSEQQIFDNTSWRAAPGDTIESHVGINLDITGEMTAEVDLTDMLPKIDADSQSQTAVLEPAYDYTLSLVDSEINPVAPVSADTPARFRVNLSDDIDTTDDQSVVTPTNDNAPELVAVLRIEIDEDIESPEQVDEAIALINKPAMISLHQVQ